MKCCACTVSNGMLTDIRWIYHDSAETHRHAAQSDTLQSVLQGAACDRRKSQSACCNYEFFHITHLNTNIPDHLYITIYKQICCLTHQSTSLCKTIKVESFPPMSCNVFISSHRKLVCPHKWSTHCWNLHK